MICGEGGNDRLFGGEGDDRLFGGEGEDRFNPFENDPGADAYSGGPGTGDWVSYNADSSGEHGDHRRRAGGPGGWRCQ